MTHEPPVPPGSKSPYPAHPAPHADTVEKDLTESGDSGEKSQGRAATKGISAVGAAVGVGSAAIVAALLYARHGRR